MLFEILKAFLIGVVEGVTEWLPISSTGHMILVDEFVKLNVSDDFLKLFLVVIQIGAILAVIILYFNKLNPFSSKKTAQERRATWRLWGMVVIGCLPAAVVGLLLDDWVGDHFYNAAVVASMLILYGVVFIVLERRNREKLANYEALVEQGGAIGAQAPRLEDGSVDPDGMFAIHTVDDIDWKAALKIGLFQCLAIIPGTSRSGATIIGGMLTGCSRTAAAEFTFFLAIPIMFGWGLVKIVKYMAAMASAAGPIMTSVEAVVLLVGIVTAFVVSVISIKFLMGYIKKNDFAPFGVYRIVVGILVLAYFGVKALLF
ncbi:undecaprenyl-diphosphate phosphatase [Slackia heliotrinireducens]|uniref:undecaprenyl-diphosphate phosphatase n=1 Tax=Slackia heliotrinireducens TaxID=84110 RepID=UPI00331482F1